MKPTAQVDSGMAETAYSAFEAVPGALDSGALIICDHASNAIPPGYGTLGLPREALERHIAYDIGAADVTRALAAELGAPAVLSTYSRLVIDPNRGLDDPTLVMRYSDGAIVPGNAYIDAAEIARRSATILGALSARDRGHGRCDDRDRRAPGPHLDPFVHPRHALARASLEDRRLVGSRRASPETADRGADRGTGSSR